MLTVIFTHVGAGPPCPTPAHPAHPLISNISTVLAVMASADFSTWWWRRYNFFGGFTKVNIDYRKRKIMYIMQKQFGRLVLLLVSFVSIN